VPVSNGQDHAFLAQLSIASATDVRRPRTIRYPLRDGQGEYSLDVTLDTVDGARLPTPVDQMIFLGLLQLALDPAQHRALYFRRRELFEVLGWEDRKDGYSRLSEALDRLQALLITPNAPIVTRNGRAYSMVKERTPLLKAYDLSAVYNGECRVEWGPLVTEAFRRQDLKRLDWGLVTELGNPLTVQLYRFLDRLTLGGYLECTAPPCNLTRDLGMADYRYPSKCRQKLQPHLDRLIQHGYVVRVERSPGEPDRYQLRPSLRSELRRALVDLGVSEGDATRLVTGYDEAQIMIYADGFRHGVAKADQPASWLSRALKAGNKVRYPSDEAQAFDAVWQRCDEQQRRTVQEAGVRLLRLPADGVVSRPSPSSWPVELRAVCRFILDQAIAPALI